MSATRAATIELLCRRHIIDAAITSAADMPPPPPPA